MKFIEGQGQFSHELIRRDPCADENSPAADVLNCLKAARIRLCVTISQVARRSLIG